MTGKLGEVCFINIWRSDNKFEWLVGSVYNKCEGVRKEENIMKLYYIKEVAWKALEDGLCIMIGGDMIYGNWMVVQMKMLGE